MNRIGLLIVAIACGACTAAKGDTDNPDAARWDQQAKNVTITRDDWTDGHTHRLLHCAGVGGNYDWADETEEAG